MCKGDGANAGTWGGWGGCCYGSLLGSAAGLFQSAVWAHPEPKKMRICAGGTPVVVKREESELKSSFEPFWSASPAV